MRKPKAFFLAAALLAVALFSGCGGQRPGPPEATTGTTAETTAMETTAMETTAAAEEPAAEQQYDEPSSSDCLEEQFAAATQGMGPEEVAAYETQVIDEAVQRQMDPRDVLAERGFPC